MADVSKITVKIGADTSGLEKEIGKAKNEASKFGDSVKKMGGLIAGAFAVSKIIQFAAESAKLAGEAEGISQAYAKISNSNIEDLRKSVKGTVSDMELMRNAVMAATLGLDASKMPELFAFAAKRANETGQEVQFLVDSIVKGIGRKSPLILDNLGISAIALKDAMGGLSLEAASVADVTAAVAKIARETTGTMEELAAEELTTAQKAQKLAAETTNLKVALGDIANKLAGAVIPYLAEFTKILALALKTQKEFDEERLKSQTSTFINGDAKAVENLASDYMILDKTLTKEAATEKARNTVISGHKKEIDKINKSLEFYNNLLKSAGQTAVSMSDADKQRINQLREQITALKNVNSAQVPLLQQIKDQIELFEQLRDKAFDPKSILKYNIEIKKLEEELENLNKIPEEGLVKLGTKTIPNIGKGIDEKLTPAIKGAQRALKYLSTDLKGASGLLEDALNSDIFASSMNAFDSLNKAVMQGFENRSIEMDNYYNAEKNAILNSSKSEEEKATLIKKLEEDVSKKRGELLKKQAIATKAVGIMEAIINTAVGIQGALKVPPPAGEILAALIAASGATQVALIASQPIPSFANEGFISKPTLAMVGDAPGGEGEYVLRQSTVRNMANNAGGGTVEFRIKDKELYGILQRYDNRKSVF